MQKESRSSSNQVGRSDHNKATIGQTSEQTLQSIISPGGKKLYAKLGNGKKIVIKELVSNGQATSGGSQQALPPHHSSQARMDGKFSIADQSGPTSFKGINYQRIRQLVSPPERLNRDQESEKRVAQSQFQAKVMRSGHQHAREGSLEASSNQQEQQALMMLQHQQMAAQQQQLQQQQEQAIAAEQAKAKAKLCRNCEGMEDFVSNLQEEIKRLETLTNGLQKQVVDCGGTPEVPDHLRAGRNYLAADGKTHLPGFKNVCPACKTFKQTQRPTSAGRIRQPGEFRIRKGNQGGPRRVGTFNMGAAAGTAGLEEGGGQLSRVSSRGGVTSLGVASSLPGQQGPSQNQASSGYSRRKQLLGL